MTIPFFLAITGAEMQILSHYPAHTAWLGCHFSSSHDGISNLPPDLPQDSLLILDDSLPPVQHSPDRVIQQLTDAIQKFSCQGVILDFQRPSESSIRGMVQALMERLPCPVAVPPAYGDVAGTSVFLPPLPPSVPLQEYLAPWKSRDIWLELSPEGEAITLTPDGAQTTPAAIPREKGFRCPQLHCHYRTELFPDHAVFTLWRTPEDINALLKNAPLGLRGAVGLYQEWKS